MRAVIPIYVEQSRQPGGGTVHTARPLFAAGPVRSGALLARVLAKLGGDIRSEIERLSGEPRHEALAALLWCPELHGRWAKLRLGLRRRTAEFRTLLVRLQSLDRVLAFSPLLPDLWFDCRSPEDVESRAVEVFTAHFDKADRDDEDDALRPEDLAVAGHAMLTHLEFELGVQQERAAVADDGKKAGRGVFGEMTGAGELQRTGRCLDALHPDGLMEAGHRTEEVAELVRLLDADDRRPVVVLGPPSAGKSAVIHQAVRRRIADAAARRPPGSPVRLGRDNVWLLSPQRLVSGMSFVGQWESRLLAITREAASRGHVLYFDDLPGLYRAGVSASSTLSMAEVLRPMVERREFRLLVECTPDAMRSLAERDRRMTDLFTVVTVAEPPPATALRMLMGRMRELEARHDCRFLPEALPAAMGLTKRFALGRAEPGRTSALLAGAAAAARGREIGRAAVHGWFAESAGVALPAVDPDRPLTRAAVEAGLGAMLVGQPGAVAAMTDAVLAFKARLTDPGRPAGVMLFLGPTGVGKTQAAKALARVLYGDAERLLRIDCNELVAPGSADRLRGTMWAPDGLLSAAVRRQPFSVVLLDEIEKAHPEVHDLLLAVLGEGRLTDALGRTADFGHTVIILTGNLGSDRAEPAGFRSAPREPAPAAPAKVAPLSTRSPGKSAPKSPVPTTAAKADTSRGFGGSADGNDEAAAWRHEAERFFRPEFLNRLDTLVVFGRLSRADIRQVAERLVESLALRSGAMQREALLFPSAAVLDLVAAEGYRPELGARALKRAVESLLASPAAAALAELPAGPPVLVSFHLADAASPATKAGSAPAKPGTVATSDVPASGDGPASPVRISLLPLVPVSAAGATGDPARTPVPLPDEGLDPDLASAPQRRFVGSVRRFVEGVEHRFGRSMPVARVAAEDLSPRHRLWFALREQALRIRRLVDELGKPAVEHDHRGRPTSAPRTASQEKRLRLLPPEVVAGLAAGSAAGLSLRERIAEASRAVEPMDADQQQRLTILAEAGELRRLAAAVDSMNADQRRRGPASGRDGEWSGNPADRAVVVVRAIGRPWTVPAEAVLASLGETAEEGLVPALLRTVLGGLWGCAAEKIDAVPEPFRPSIAAVAAEGPGVSRTAQREAGLHLAWGDAGRALLFEVRVLPGEGPSWRTDWQALSTAAPSGGGLVRIWDRAGGTLDLRTGLMTTGLPRPSELRLMITRE